MESYRYPYTWTSPLSELSDHDLHELSNEDLFAIFQAHKRQMLETLIIRNRSNTHGNSLNDLIKVYDQQERTIPAINDVITYRNQLYFTAARLNVYDRSLSQFYRADLWLTPDLSDQVIDHRIEIKHQINIDKIDYCTANRATLKPQLIDIFEVIVKIQTKLPPLKAEQLTQQIQTQLQDSWREPPLTESQLPFTCQPLNALV